jgi:hypothetical protein
MSTFISRREVPSRAFLRCWRTGIILIVLASEASAQSPTTAPTTQSAAPPDTTNAPVSPSGQAVVRIILDLDNADFDVRKRAGLRLNSLGGDALPAVEAAIRAQLASPEARIRLESAARILRKRARLEKLNRERLAWKNRQFFESYRIFGKSDPAFDQSVKTAMEAFLQLGGEPANGPPELRTRVLDGFQAAVDAGCDDPLVAFMQGLAVGKEYNPGPGRGPGAMLVAEKARQFLRSKYPATIKYWVIWRSIRVAPRWTSGLEAEAAKLVPEIAATPGIPATELDVNAEQLFDALNVNGLRDERLCTPFLDAYTAARPGAPGPLVMKARVYMAMAEQARQVGNFADMQAKLDEAEKALEVAWKLDPAEPRAPSLMITVKMGQREGGGGREALETWFVRAMGANPDNYDACRRKLNYLHPNWNGSEQEMLEFGRWCLKTGNWRANIPFILAQAHEIVSDRSKDRLEYYSRPEVWEDLRGVYEGCVLNFPDAVPQRNKYAQIAAQCGQWDVAQEQFQVLGDKAMPEIFGGEATLNYYKRKAARLAKLATRPQVTNGR